MLRSLEIRNYRNLRHLTIEKLGRVNLLVGKNNTGKTSVLEAIGVLLKKGEPQFILNLIADRGENNISKARFSSGRAHQTANSIATLFTDRTALFNQQNPLSIIAEQQSDNSPIPEIRIELRLIRYAVDYNEIEDELPTKRKIVFLDENYHEYEAETGLEVKYNNTTVVYSLNSFWKSDNRVAFGGSETSFDYIKTNNLYRETDGQLWDNISLTDKEDYVLDALRIVEAGIDDMTFIDGDKSEGSKRLAIVRLKSSNQKIPLRSMGDGINRVLTIILSMVNCENGYLLIDEFENGLHYSVQKKLWEIVFFLAGVLDLQVFATTHSNDTIKAFGEVSNSRTVYSDVKLIQLRNVKGEISAVSFNAQDVEVATETDYLDLR